MPRESFNVFFNAGVRFDLTRRKLGDTLRKIAMFRSKERESDHLKFAARFAINAS
jgi:hypothetical protein